jgi:hypothetical protein
MAGGMLSSLGSEGGGGGGIGGLFPAIDPQTWTGGPSFAQLELISSAIKTGNIYAAAVVIILVILDDVILELISLFSGRPREQATEQVIAQFLKSKNLVGHIAGVQLKRLLHDNNIVISDSSKEGQALLGAVAHQFVVSMEAQGYTRVEAFDAYTHVLSRASQAGAPLPAMLNVPIAGGLALVGTAEDTDYFNAVGYWYTLQGLDQATAVKKAIAWVLRNTPNKNIGKWTVQPSGPEFQPTNGPPPTVPRARGLCPPGYKYDAKQKLCALDLPLWPKQPAAPTPPPTPTPTPTPTPQPVPQPPTPACPAGYVWDEQTGSCVPLAPQPQCPPGQVFDPISGVCVPLGPTGPGPQTCPVGFAWNPASNSCTPAPQNGSCPPGYAFNPQTETCDPAGVLPGPQGGPQIPITIPPPTAPQDPYDPEANCCYGQQLYGYYIAQTIQALTATLAAGTANPCCTQILAGLNELTSSVQTLVAAFTQPGTPTAAPTDLAQVTEALAVIGAAVQALPIDADANTVRVTDALAGITTAIDNLAAAAPVDLAGIKAALDEANVLQDVPTTILDQLQNYGLIDPAYAASLQGSPASWVSTILKAIENSRIYQKWKQGEMATAKGDPLLGPAYEKVTTGKGPSYSDLTASDVKTFTEESIKALFTNAFEVGKTAFGPIIDFMLAVHRDEIAKLGTVRPGDENPVATALVTEAMTFGTAAHFAACAAEIVSPLKNLGIGQMAGVLSTLAGFDEIMKGIIGVEVRQAVALPHTYFINSQKRSLQPNLGQAVEWFARRKISAAQFQTLRGYAGLTPDADDYITAAAYRPISPRALATAIVDTPFPTDEMRTILEDNGLAPASVNFMLQVLEYNSTKNVRTSYVSEVLTAYAAGVMSDQEFNQVLDGLGWSDTAKQFEISRAQLQRRVNLAKAVEAQIVALVAAGSISPEVGQSQLESAGVVQWKADLEITLATTRADIHAAKLAATAEHKLELARQRAASTAAVSEYHAGRLDSAGLAAALLAAGVDPLVATLTGAAQEAIRAGRLRLVYGQLLAPEPAKVLSDQVAAIESQLKKQLIDLAQAGAQLNTLNLPEPERNALLARWEAMLVKPSTTGQLVSPWTGAPIPTPPAPSS